MLARRELLGRLTLLFGGSLLAPCAAFLRHGRAGTGAAHPPAPSLLSPEQRMLLATASEIILPTTDTPGARAAGVPEFIEYMLAEWYYDDEREIFLSGLARLDALSRERAGKPFVEAGEAVQTEILAQAEKEGFAALAAKGVSPMTLFQERAPLPGFFLALKQLVLVGYYTSEIGATQELVFDPIPGTFDGCIAVGSRGRLWTAGI